MMSHNHKSTSKLLLSHFLFTRRFRFRTPIRVDDCAERISHLPFIEGNNHFTAQIEPVTNGQTFDLWSGNRFQREPHQARVISHGHITSFDGETIVEGEVRFTIKRMLMMSILTILMALWLYSMLITPYWFIYLFYTGGLPLFAPIYLFWQTRKERNRLLNEIQIAVTPHQSDYRTERLADQQPDQEWYSTTEQNKQRYSRR